MHAKKPRNNIPAAQSKSKVRKMLANGRMPLKKSEKLNDKNYGEANRLGKLIFMILLAHTFAIHWHCRQYWNTMSASQMPWMCFFSFYFRHYTRRRKTNVRDIFNKNEKQRHNDNLIFFVTSSDCALYCTRTIQSFAFEEWHIRRKN